ncbi:MAG: hypothetical protein E2O41_06665 [Nitrospina sp.]|nr:MAG: hypothetical protein E2O41_06665 [Nitrospina sp.]
MNWIKTLALALVFIFGMGSNDFSIAQGTLEANQDEIELTRAIIKVQKKQLIAKNMNFTPSEKEKFWKLYREYQDQLDFINGRRVKLITDFADALKNKSLSDEKALKILNGSLHNKRLRLSTKQSFVDKFQEILPGKKVARFFQLENKLDAIINFELARQIPLVQ